MILHDAVTAELPYLRAEAEARMLDTFQVSTPGVVSYDRVTKKNVVTDSPLFVTRGRLKSAGLQSRDAQVGDRTSTSVVRELHIPVTSPAVPDDAVIVVTAVDATSDPTLLGTRLRVTGPAPGSQTTARRFQVEEVLT